MKKVILLIFVSILLLAVLTACGKKECKHEEWTEATCQSAKTCVKCGIKEGTALPHKSVSATCTTPQMCSVCGFTSEFWTAALGHDWAEASCLRGTAKTCKRCNAVEGEVPDHTWTEPTCISDSVCEVCEKTNTGSKLGHNYVHVDEVSPTCTAVGHTEGEQCSRCGHVQSGVKEIPAIEHKGYETNVPGYAATCDTDGLSDGLKCSLCNTVIESQQVLDAKGHQRYTYNDKGEVIGDSKIVTVYPINPDTGLPYAACESDGITTYECVVCSASVQVAEPKVNHKYPENATCNDPDAKCEYCKKNIEHEFLDPTCTEAATCRICGDTDPNSSAFNHIDPQTGESAMLAATCKSPSMCSLCGHTEGQKLVHKLEFSYTLGKSTYSCSTCDTVFTPQDEVYYFDGSTHANIVPVNNIFGGYETFVDAKGNPTDMPAIKTDANGNDYYSLIKVREPSVKDKTKNELYPPQLQLWLPMSRNGFKGFNSSNAPVGFLSFKMNAYMDQNIHLSILSDAKDWGKDAAIKDIFNILAPDDEYTTVRITAYGYDPANESTANRLLLVKDLAGITNVEDMFTGWIDVAIGIVMDSATDTVSFHYYINGQYKCSVSIPLELAGDAIKCCYISGNTDTINSGLLLDDISFGYTAFGLYGFDTNHEHVYNLVSEEVMPTCTTDGYRVYSCDCGAIGTRVSMPTLGHDAYVVDELPATCTEPGHSSYSYCMREECGVVIEKKVDYPATGHDYDVKTNRPASCLTTGALRQTCKTCGHEVKQTIPALGHEYPLDGDCKLGGTCIREGCGFTTTMPIGCVFGEPTCTEPAHCLRTGCTETTGEPLGHDMAAPTCTTPSTCTVCQYSEGERIPHTITYKYSKSVLTYYCPDCNTSFSIDNGYYLNGTGHNDMVGITGNNSNYTVTSGTELPKIVSGHYEFINTTGKKGQLQIWIPGSEYSSIDFAGFGFSSANNAVGFLSFKINANMTNNFDIKLVDVVSNKGSSDTNPNRWKPGGVAGHFTVSTVENGKVTFKLGTVAASGAQTNAHTLAEVAVGSNNFTGWVDIVIGIVLDPVTDQITYHCYTNGEYVLSFSSELTTNTNSISAIYITGNTTDKNSGLMMDDIAFGYTANGTWVFDDCKHDGTPVVVPPTCTEDGYTKTVCTKCGHIGITEVVPAFGHTELEGPDCTHGYLCQTCGEYYGEALGHIGGTPTCTEKPVCERCEEAYGSTQHTVIHATCSTAAYCDDCGEVFGTPVSHCPVATLDVAAQKVTFSCKYCEASYTLDKVYYRDGETSIGGAVPFLEDSSYVLNENGNYNYLLESNAAGNGKAWMWVPSNTSGVSNFDKFKPSQGAVGVISFSLDIYTDKGFQIHLIDTANRSSKEFWSSYTMQGIFKVSAPSNNVVTVTAYGGTVLKTFNVSDENKYTGMFDVTIGIEMISGGNVAFHYYINGEYITSVTDKLTITSLQVDGAAFLCESNTAGCGFTLDNIVFGYAVPNTSSNPAPLKPKD